MKYLCECNTSDLSLSCMLRRVELRKEGRDPAPYMHINRGCVMCVFCLMYSYSLNTQRCDLFVSPPVLRHRLLHPPTRPPAFQEEDSPDRGELRRAESSPTPLKRDRSFSEHDLALLRGGGSPSLAEPVQQDGTVRLRDERPRSRTLTGSRPVPRYRGQYL